MTLPASRWLVLAAYFVAIAGACATLPFSADLHPLFRVLVADTAATAIVFTFSFATGNSSIYDPYWSVAPPVICLYMIVIASDAIGLRQIVVLVVVLAWSIRLTGNWLYGWQGIGHEDWRYVDLKAKSGKLWWPLSFAGIHLFPTLVVFLGCISLYPALVTGAAPINWLDILALALGIASVTIEFMADRQLHRHRASRASPAEVMDQGTWAWCRHPNYLGEIGFWVALFLFAVASTSDTFWLLLSATGPVAMILLFTGVSIPMIEDRLMEHKADYARYRQTTSSLLPWPPARDR